LERRRKILVAPLDWGLGHATRCIPLIRAILKRNAEVIIAASSNSAELLKREFPELKHYALPGYNPRYPSGMADSDMVWAMGGQLLHFMRVINREHAEINNLVKKEKADVLISDNRYGCYSKQATSVFITHQPHILMPDSFKWMEPGVNFFNHRQMNHFDAIWIPAPDNSLLGKMAPDSLPPNTRYIGTLSRMNRLTAETKYDLVVVASGPEPQRQMLVELLRPQLIESGLRAYLVAGKMGGAENITTTGNLTEASYLEGGKLNNIIQQARLVIARPGYSTVMDLARLGAKAIFIPTPGQTEQAHLAERLMQQGIAFSMPQAGFNLPVAIKKANKFSGFANFVEDESLLDKAMESIL
jgi:uncharacterized protein (TIGR00661 family)